MRFCEKVTCGSLSDLRGTGDLHSTLDNQFFHFHAVFCKNWSTYSKTPLYSPPRLGNPGSTTGHYIASIVLFYDSVFLSIEWKSVRLGGPTHGMVTKTEHKAIRGYRRAVGSKGPEGSRD